MKKMMAMLLASVMAAGTFTTTAFAYTLALIHICGESCTHGVEPGKSWRLYQRLTYGYLVPSLRV